MRILGIDPGLATVGFSIIDVDKAKMKLVTCGIISTPAHTSLSSRLDRIFDDLNELISTFSPDVMSIEELFFNTNITTGISVAHAICHARSSTSLLSRKEDEGLCSTI